MLEKKKFWEAVRGRPEWLLLPLFESGFLNWMDDKTYLKIQYWAYTGKKLNLKNPGTFNEKISWLKLYDRRKIYRLLADKYFARRFVEKVLGSSWLVPVYGVWKSVKDIDFENLPNQFVLKCSHGYGGTVICKDKEKLDIKNAKKILTKTIRTDFYGRSREWTYYHPHPRILAEKLVDDKGGERPADYKFMCFNGEVRYVCISRSLRDFDKGCLSFYQADGKKAPFKRVDYLECPSGQKLPQCFDEMKRAAERLAKKINLPFVRTDFYEEEGKVYFSEFTFYPCGGTMVLNHEKYDRMLGDMINLPERMEKANAGNQRYSSNVQFGKDNRSMLKKHRQADLSGL